MDATMKFITLGPARSNHEYVTRRYLQAHGLRDRAEIVLAPDFDVATAAIQNREADYLIQCAVHPATCATVAKFIQGLYVIDTFISPSQALGILKRRNVSSPQTLAVMQPTLDYIDSSKWAHILLAETVRVVSDGLISGQYEAGLAYIATAEEHPELLEVMEFIGTVDDAWIVYGRERVNAEGFSVWTGSPAARMFARQDGGRTF